MIIPHARDAEMHEHIKAWQASGKSQTSYCKQHGIIPHQFIYYKKKLGFMKSTSTNNSIGNQLVPVTLKSDNPDEHPVWIEHHTGFKIELTAHSDLAQISRALSVIRDLA